MSDEKKDVNEDLETSSEESTEENLEESKEKKDIPYDRFSKVVEERNRLREEAEEKERKLQELNKALNPEPESPEEKKDTSLSREEAILYAKGYDDETVERLKKIAQVEDTDLLEAEKTDIFTAWKEKKEAEANNQAAQLGASSSSAPHREEGFKPGMSKDEHKALWNKAKN